MQEIKVYTSSLQLLLGSKTTPKVAYQYEEINLQGNQELMIDYAEIWTTYSSSDIVGEHSVGGYQELLASITSNEFSKLVEATG